MLEEELLDIQINSEDQREIIQNGIGISSDGKGTMTRPRRGRARKATADQQSRCGCGNTYSCSSALSLHIKNKHGGQVPEGSIGFPSSNYRRRDNSNRQTGQSQTTLLYKTNIDRHRTAVGLNKESNFNLNEFDHQFNDILVSTDSDPNQQISSIDINLYPQRRRGYQRKYKSGNRQYVSKRIYLCGCCFTCFGFLEELMLHFRKAHNGDIPDGSIFGLKRQSLLRFFHIQPPKPNPNRKYYIFKCGCGKEYTCSSSLYYHIKTVHGGSQPQGTFGMARPA